MAEPLTRNLEIKIFVGGDTLPLNRDLKSFVDSDYTTLFGSTLKHMQKCNFRVLNLEGPLVDSQSPISKCGPNLSAPVNSVGGFSGIDLIGLANNHIRDHGLSGLRSTLSTLDRAGISYVGIGDSPESSLIPVVRDIGGIRVAFMGMASREFSTVRPGMLGGAPADPIEFHRALKRADEGWDFLVVLLHSGRQFYPYPSPDLYRFCHFLVEEGADAVICQHSHCLGCEEWYRGKYIIYGQGDFIFDYGPSNRDHLPGAGLILKFGQNGYLDRELILHQHNNGPGIEAMPPWAEGNFLELFSKRSREIAQPGFVVNNWETYCKSVAKKTLRHLALPPGKIWRVINRILDLGDLFMPLDQRNKWLNYVSCEELREVLISVLTDDDNQCK